MKEAGASVLEPYVGRSEYEHSGQRVVAGQHLMQAMTDIFLGWTHTSAIDFYVRQLRDMKGSVDLLRMRDVDARRLRGAVRTHAGARPRADARPRTDQRLPRPRPHVRRRDRRVLGRVRGRYGT